MAEMASADPLKASLVKLYRDEPAQFAKMESELAALKASALKAKEKAQASSSQKMKSTIKANESALRHELESLKAHQSSLQAQAKKLQQLTSAGDEASIIRFFKEQGMSPDDLRRALTGDAAGAIQDLSTRQPKEENAKADQALELADNLSRALGGQEVAAPEEPTLHYGPENKPQPQIVQPDVWQRQPTPSDQRLIVTVCLPKLESAKEAELDIAYKHIRLTAKIDDSQQYMLSIPLRKRIQPNEAKAKWSRKTRQLEIALPVDE